MTFTATLLRISVASKVCLCKVRSSNKKKKKLRMKMILNQKTFMEKSAVQVLHMFETQVCFITTFIKAADYNVASFIVIF